MEQKWPERERDEVAEGGGKERKSKVASTFIRISHRHSKCNKCRVYLDLTIRYDS